MAGKTVPRIYCFSMTLDRLSVYIASTEKGVFRVGLGWMPSRHPVLFFKGDFPDADVTEHESRNQPFAEAIEAAFFNRPTGRPVPLDVSLTPFQRDILETVTTIPFGQTRTYGDVGSLIGKPLAARAVGQVMARNPLPLIFP